MGDPKDPSNSALIMSVEALVERYPNAFVKTEGDGFDCYLEKPLDDTENERVVTFKEYNTNHQEFLATLASKDPDYSIFELNFEDGTDPRLLEIRRCFVSLCDNIDIEIGGERVWEEDIILDGHHICLRYEGHYDFGFSHTTGFGPEFLASLDKKNAVLAE